MSDSKRAITVAVVGIVIALVAAAAVNIYVVPEVKNDILAKATSVIDPAVDMAIRAKYPMHFR